MIGSLHLFRLIANLLLYEFFLAFTELFTAGAFLAMFARDSKKTRMIFFSSYCFYITLINFMELYLRKYPTEEERASKQAYFEKWCDDNMEEYGYTQMNECTS